MWLIVEVLWGQQEVRLGLALTVLTASAVGAYAASRRRAWVAPAGLALAVGTVLSVTIADVVVNRWPGAGWWSQ